ncbi:MAG: hypothetical protein M3083_16275 [Actinomycetota bacterium]|nr:hypothetical protein [Actinomycetota bacterium]
MRRIGVIRATITTMLAVVAVGLLVAMLAAAALLVPAAPAGAATAVDRAVGALRQDPVYVDPAAERPLTAAEADRLRGQIRSSQPILVALLPSSALAETGTTANQLTTLLARQVGLAGTYAVVVGNSFRATSTADPATASALATAAFQQHSGEGTAAVLSDFVARVASARPASIRPGGFWLKGSTR